MSSESFPYSHLVGGDDSAHKQKTTELINHVKIAVREILHNVAAGTYTNNNKALLETAVKNQGFTDLASLEDEVMALLESATIVQKGNSAISGGNNNEIADEADDLAEEIKDNKDIFGSTYATIGEDARFLLRRRKRKNLGNSKNQGNGMADTLALLRQLVANNA